MHSYDKIFSPVNGSYRRGSHIARKGVEVRPILEIFEVLVEFVLPYNAPCPIQIDEFEVECSLRILREHETTL